MPLVSPKKLYRAIEYSDRRLKPYRESRTRYVNEYAPGGGARGDKRKRVLNLMQRSMDMLAVHLASFNPEHDVTTNQLALRPQATLRGLMLDHWAAETDLAKLSRRLVMGAFFGPGMQYRVGIRAGSEVFKINDRLYNRGQPYMRPVDLDDTVFDPMARTQEEAIFQGEYYRIPRDLALESGLFRPEIIERLPTIDDGRTGTRQDRLEDLTQHGLSQHERYGLIPMLELIDVAIYDDGRIWMVTLPASGDYVDQYLRIEEWQGPERGPFRWLGFHEVLGQPFYRPLASVIWDQAEAMNIVLHKLLKQITRTKRLLLYQKRKGSDDAEIVRESDDGDVVGIDGEVQDLANVDIGGASPEFAPFVDMLLGYSNVPLGNLDILSGGSGKRGKGDGSDTATEYQGKVAAASMFVNDLQKTHEQTHNEIAEFVDWQLDSDPLIFQPLIKRVPGGEFIDLVYDSMTKEGDFSQFTEKIRTRSMVYQDPQVRMKRVTEAMGLLLEAAAVELQTGGRLDAAATARVFARLHDIPELDEILRDPVLLQERMMQMQGLPPQGQGVPAGQSGNPQAAYRARPQGAGGGGSGRGGGGQDGTDGVDPMANTRAALGYGYAPAGAA